MLAPAPTLAVLWTSRLLAPVRLLPTLSHLTTSATTSKFTPVPFAHLTNACPGSLSVRPIGTLHLGVSSVRARTAMLSSSSAEHAQQIKPSDVTDYWFGVGMWGSGSMAEAAKSKMPLWWGIREDYSGPVSSEERERIDGECQKFAELVRACARGELKDDPEWETLQGLFAQMILCDQLSRNCFRGTPEAYAYDGTALQFARRLVERKAYTSYELPQFTFLITPMEHSEEAADHETNIELVKIAQEKFGKDDNTMKQLERAVLEHKAVIDRFGRYPHRNKALGRENTPEETAWLEDVKNLPAWARSQL